MQVQEENSTQALTQAHDQSLKKQLTVFDSISLVIGSVIGSGIFVSPTRVFALLDASPVLALIAWVGAAIISLAGALCYAELGCLFPRAGAEYEYLKNGMGRFWGFLFSWAQLIVLGTGSIAILAIVSSEYLFRSFLPDSSQLALYTKLGACVLVAVLTFINCFGIESGSHIQNALTVIKVISIAFLLGLGIFYFKDLNPSNLFLPIKTGGNFFQEAFRFGSALIACLWAYDGWNNLSRVTEESVDVQKTLPKGLFIGVFLVSLIYLALNCLYFLILSPQEILNTKAIALTALSTLGQKVAWLNALGAPLIIGLIIFFSASGATNGSVLSGARIYFAAARDGLFFDVFGHTHHKTKAPVAALILQGVWSILLITLGNFETLLDYFSFSAWIFYGLCASILIYLRLQNPELERPFRVPLFPITPILFLGAALFLVLSQVVNSPIPSLLSLLGIGSGVIFYYSFIKLSSRSR